MTEETATRLPDDNALVIGEGVILDLHPATFASRILSGLIDYVLLGLTLTLTMIGLTALLVALDTAAASALYLATGVAVLVGLPTVIETLTRGKSVGRWALGLRVVRDDGGPIRVRHAAIRAMLSMLEIWTLSGALALLCTMLNPRGKRLGDMLAGTYVVRERGYRAPTLMLGMPAALVGWAHNADIARLPDDLAMSARTFMLRRLTLAPGARAALGVELADAVRQRVSPGPPSGTHPEAFLEAILVERRERELARLRREQDIAAQRRHTLGRQSHLL